MHYLKEFSTRQTPQSEKIPGTSQAENSADGHAWQVDNWTRLHRFLILGSEGGSYYASERTLTKENATAVMRCITEDGPRTVKTIVDVSKEGRAPKNDPAIFALALACASNDAPTRRVALDAIPDVCRIGTHLFHFATYVEQFRGWGRGLRRAVGAWYQREDLDSLSYQLVKYRQRDGWTHGDLLRLAHPEPPSDAHGHAYRFALGKEHIPPSVTIEAFQRAQTAEAPEQTIKLIEEYGDKLPREAIQPEHLTKETWAALINVGMPMTALIRNLATMTRLGTLTPTTALTSTVVKQITDEQRIRKARVHPIAVLAALRTYAYGYSARGTASWSPVPQIVDALDEAFYKAFENVKPTGKRYLLGIDVSGSMDSGQVAGIPGLTPRVASSAMAMVTAAVGDPYECVAFTSQGGGGWRQNTSLYPFTMTPRARLDNVCSELSRLPFGGTDCALPMLYAIEQNREVDCFVIYTDSETWAGNIHPSQALQKYREQSGINAKLIIVGMVSNGFSIADPNDAGMLDVVGFDTATPQAISSFALL